MSTYDFSRLAEAFAGDPEIALAAADAFLASAPEMLATVTACRKPEKTEALQAATHMLKGALSVFGAHPLYEKVRAAHEYLREREPGRALALLAPLEADFAEFVRELGAWAERERKRV